MKKSLLYVAPILSRSGYGDHAREFAEFLLSQTDDIDFNVIATPWGKNPQTGMPHELNESLSKHFTSDKEKFKEYDIFVQMGLPNEFKKIGKKLNIGITAGVEVSCVGKDFIDGLNLMDHIIVPSNFTKETFENSKYTDEQKNVYGVTTPISVISEISNSLFYSESECDQSFLEDVVEEFCFLTVGQWDIDSEFGDRKNLESVVDTFLNTFQNEKNKPALILKVYCKNNSVSDFLKCKNKIKEIKKNYSESNCNVYLIHGDINDQQLYSLYNNDKIKAFVSHTKGEGFGRPILEASLSAIPIIATKWSGHLDIIDKKHSLLIPGQLTNVGISNNIFAEDSKWMQVNTDYSATQMKKLFAEYKRYKDKANKLRLINIEKFDKQKVFGRYKELLQMLHQ